jgi:hypothetical protein
MIFIICPSLSISSPLMTHAPSKTRRSEGPHQHRIFPFPLARRALEWLFYFPFRKSVPTVNFKNSPFCFGKSDFVLSRIHWSCARLSSPRNPKTVNADPSSSLSGFSLSQFRRSRYQATCSYDSRNPMIRNSDMLTKLSFQPPFTPSGLRTSQYRKS